MATENNHDDLQAPPDRIVLPRYNIAKIMAARQALDQGAAPLYGRSMVADDLQRLAVLVENTLSVRGAHRAVIESLTEVTSRELTPALWAPVAWRLAGNVPRLKGGLSVAPWSAQTAEEWCPVQIDAVEKQYRFKTDTHGAEVHFRVLAGSPAGRVTVRFWGNRFMRTAKLDLGFSRRFDPPELVERKGKWVVKNFPFQDPTELTRLRLWALFTAEHSRPGQPGFYKITNSATFKNKWNRQVLLLRTRMTVPCPRNYDHACCRCPVGYNSCRAGCHPSDHVSRLCLSCHRQAWHDPAHGADSACIACRARS